MGRYFVQFMKEGNAYWVCDKSKIIGTGDNGPVYDPVCNCWDDSAKAYLVCNTLNGVT